MSELDSLGVIFKVDLLDPLQVFRSIDKDDGALSKDCEANDMVG